MTTSSRSANGPGLPDRRHFLSTLSAVGALGLAATPSAMAEAPGPIEAMWPEHLRLEAEHDAACDRTWDAERDYDEPERPTWHPFLEEAGYVTIANRLGHSVSVLSDGENNVAYLKALIAREFEPDDPDVGYVNAHRAERAKKTLAKIETWQAEVRRRKDAAGLTNAEAEEAAARTAAYAHRDAILAIKAATFRELAFQAAVLDLDVDLAREHSDHVLERLIGLAGVTPYGLA